MESAARFLDGGETNAAAANRAQLTVYTRFDDGPEYYDGRTAVKNPLTGRAKAAEGVTIAVDPELIPYGSKVRIPKLASFSANGDGIFIAHDTGGDVRKRKASGGKFPVLDVFVDGSDARQAQKKRDALASALGTDPLDFEIVQPGTKSRPPTAEEFLGGSAIAMSPEEADQLAGKGQPLAPEKLPEKYQVAPDFTDPHRNAPPASAADFLDDVDTGEGRLKSAAETFAQTAETGAGVAVQGLGSAASMAVDAERGGNQAEALRELDSLNRSSGQALKLPPTPENRKLAEDVKQRADYLRGTLSGDQAIGQAQALGTEIRDDAQQRFTPNPAYRGEFLAETVPQVAGSAVSSVAPFLVPGVGAAAGSAAMFGQTFQDSMERNLAAGEPQDTARERALQTAIVSGGLESVGSGIVANVAKRLATTSAARATPEALRLIAQGAAAEFLTGAGQETTAQVVDERPIDVGEIVKQGALEAMGGGMITGAAAGVGAISRRVREGNSPGQPRTDTEGAATPAATMSAEEFLAEAINPPEAVPVSAPEAFSGTTTATPPAPPAIAPAAAESLPPAPADPASDSVASSSAPSLPVDEGTRQNLVRNYSFPAGLAEFITQEEAATLMQSQPGSRKGEAALWGAMRVASQRQEAAGVAEEENVQRSTSDVQRSTEGTAATAPVIDTQSEIGNEPDPDIPFAKQVPSSVPEAEQQRLRGLMREAWRGVGERQGPEIAIVATAEEVPAWLSGDAVRQAVSSGGIVEAYFLASQTRSGQPVRRVVLLRDGAAQVATDRGTSFEKRVQQLALHEVVHHYGTLGVLLPKPRQRQYNTVIDGVIARAQREAPELIGYLTQPKEQGGYGFTLEDAAGRAAIAEEYLARFAEGETKAPGWVTKTFAKVRELLRAAFPRMQWTDGDIRTLLASARRRAAAKVDDATAAPRFAKSRGKADPNQLELLPGAATSAFSGDAAPISRQADDDTAGTAPAARFAGILGQIATATKEELQEALTAGRGRVSSILPERRGEGLMEAPLVSFAKTPEQRRQFVQSVRDAAAVLPQVKERVESLYQPITNKETIEAARNRINELGLEGAEREILATDGKVRASAPTALSNAMGIELMGRLQQSGQFERAAAIATHLAEQATSQGQAIQALSLLAKLSPEGIQVYAARVVKQAVAEGAVTPEVAALLKQLDALKAELAKARKAGATKAVLDIHDALVAAGFDGARLAELQGKLRTALELASSEPGNAEARIVGILIAAGMDRKKAVALAKKAVAETQRQAKAARDRMLKAMLTIKVRAERAPKLSPAEALAKKIFRDPISKVRKSELQRWIEMNEAGLLDDSKFFGKIAAKYGFPIFGENEARMIQGLQRKFAEAPDGDAKLVAGARMMDAIHSLVPSGFWAKANGVRTLAMLLNPKTIIRNVIGNAALAIADTTADSINGWVVDPLVSLVTRQRTQSSAGVAARLSGLAQPARDFAAGMRQAREEGVTGKLNLAIAGVDYLATMGRIVSSRTWDAKDFNTAFRHTFSSRTMRLFEDGLASALGAGDRAFHAAAFQASLANQMAVAEGNGETLIAPTPDMITRALIDANRAVMQDENMVSTFLIHAKRTGNYLSPQTVIQGLRGEKLTPGDLGLGSAVIPFAQVPGAVMARGAEFSPIGFVRAAYELLPRTITHKETFDQQAFSRAFSRAIVGSAGMALGAWLLRLGVLSALPEEDKDLESMRRTAGLGGLRVNVSELWRRLLSLNFAPARSMFDAAQDGDTVISYDWLQPAAFTVAAGAQASVEAQKHTTEAAGGKLPAASTAFMAGLLGASNGFTHMSVLTGLKRFSAKVGQRESLPQALAEQVLSLPSSFVPTIVKDLNSAMDNRLRETRTDAARHPLDAMVNATLERIPGAAAQFPPRYDAFGQAMERFQYGGNTLWNVFVNPSFTSAVRKTPELREIERIYAATLDSSATPRGPDRTVTVNGRPRELTNEELAGYRYFTGRVAGERLRMMLASPVWARLPEPVQARYIARAWSDATTAGKIVLLGDRPKQNPGAGVAIAARRGMAIGAPPRE